MRYEVSQADTADAVGSGDVAVLATPRLIAWVEAATLAGAAPLIGAGQTTVGTVVRVEHRRPSSVGDGVEVVTEPPPAPAASGRLTFRVRASDDAGRVVATGEIDRAIVDRDRFSQPGPQADPDQ